MEVIRDTVHDYLSGDMGDYIAVLPSHYSTNPEDYQDIREVVYVIQSPRGDYAVIPERDYDCLFARSSTYDVIFRLFITRPVAPKGSDEYSGYLLSGEEYSTNPDQWVVIDTCVIVVTKEWPYTSHAISTDVYQRERSEYDLLRVLHICRFKNEGDES